jgi:serine/threonine protein kinase
MISFACPGCGEKFRVKDELAGKRGKCPKCKAAIMLPAVGPVDGPTLMPAGGPAPLPIAEGATLNPSASGYSGREADTSMPEPASARDNQLTDFLAPPQGPGELGRLGGYRVLKVLGHGGMGVVFQAEDVSLRRLVALKAMLPRLAASGSAAQRFLREAQAMAAVKHDHVVTVYQVGEDRGVPFLAMEFLEGEPLDVRLQREQRLPLREILRIGRETALGLAAAQARGMIHRDIKPANLWLEGDNGRVKILDFGLARSVSDDSQLTQQGAIIGTPAYMAPEQVGNKYVDGRADLFSLGCVLYRLSTGELPFKGSDTLSTLMAVASETPAPPAKLNPKVPVAFSDLVMQLLAKDPAGRPASARAVVEAIQAIENGTVPDTVLSAGPGTPGAGKEPAEAADRPAGTKKRKKRSNGGLPAWWPAATVGAGVVLLGVGFLLARGSRPRPAAPTDPVAAVPGGRPGDGGKAPPIVAPPRIANPGTSKPNYMTPNVHPTVGEDLPPLPAGGLRDLRFVEPDGRLLGLEYHMGSWAGEKRIGGLVPVFSLDQPQSKPSRELARPGYAVAGAEVYFERELYVYAIRLLFRRVKPDGSLDAADAYAGEWIGTPRAGAPRTLANDGHRVIGIRLQHGLVIDRFALVVAK